MESTWQQLSKELSEKIASAGRSVVAVDGRGGHTSSGILWREGLVLTAAHTLRQTSGIGIILEQGATARAEIAGRASGVDLALLRIDGATNLTPAEFGDTTGLTVGEFVTAVARTRRGNVVASAGILGGVMGQWQVGRMRLDQFIRPDLSLYPGFSGGALIDSSGKILGMVNGGFLRGRPVTIPASMLTRIGEELLAKGHLARPYIGLAMQPVNIPQSLQKTSGVNAESGLLVMHVEPKGPADSSGVLLGDVLVALDSQAIEAFADLQDVIAQKGVNADVKASLIRGGQKVELTVKVGERPVR